MNYSRLLPFAVSVYTNPRSLGKHIELNRDGTLEKKSMGQIIDGLIDRETMSDLAQFAEHRAALKTSQALGYGVAAHLRARVVTKSSLATSSGTTSAGDALPVVARDGQHLSFASGPGVVMLDHDPAPGCAAMTADELHDAICAAMPALRAVTMLWASSSGSMIFKGDEELVGLRGSRMYFVVSDARRIPEVAERLFDRLVLAGHGRIFIARSGRMLHRGPIDASVYQPERLDYVHATCGPGLEQRPAPWRLFEGEWDLMDGQTMLDAALVEPLTDKEKSCVADAWVSLERASSQAADDVRHAWAIGRASADIGAEAATESREVFDARVTSYETASQTLVLDLDQPLSLADGREVTVAELRADPKKFDKVRMADPLEPEYGKDRRIAVAYLLRDGGQDPAIYSHAHGGTWYSLRDPTEDFDGLDDCEPVPGVTPTGSVEFIALSPRPEPSRERPRFTVQNVGDFTAGPPPKWHIRDVLPEGELIVIYGASGSGKSFVVLNMVTAIANGTRWRDKATSRGRVVYVVAEGLAGFRKRVEALVQHQNVDLAAFDLGIVTECPNLLDGDEEALGTAIKAAGGAAIVVIDTLAQTMGGGDENSSTDMGLAVSACKKLHAATGATVLLIHHSGKDATKGARGWSGLRAAADAELEVVSNPKGRTLRITKQKDGDDSSSFAFKLDIVKVDLDDDLHDITSCVVRHLDNPMDGFGFDGVDPGAGVEAPSGKWQRRLWDYLKGEDGPVPYEELLSAVVTQEPKAADAGRDTRKQNAKRALDDMLADGSLTPSGSGVVLAVQSGRSQQAMHHLHQSQQMSQIH